MGAEEEQQQEVVIVGGGICGLATALALHRKGIPSLVLEKSDSLRAAGSAIGIYLNGWRALDQLGVGVDLRTKAIPILEMRDAWLNKNKIQVTPCRNEGLRCLKRSDLIEALANGLPANSVRFQSEMVAVETDPATSFPVVHVDDGTKIKAKVLIGCDGSNSVTAKLLGLENPRLFPVYGVRGFTNYPNGHIYGSYALRLRGDRIVFGRIPIDDKLVYWFVAWGSFFKDSEEVQRDPHCIKNLTLELLKDFPMDVTEMVKSCDLGSLSLTHIRYRAPWHFLSSKGLRKGTMTVAGDAMHVMGPFLGQGGSCGLEDAIVLARCLARELRLRPDYAISDEELKKKAAAALSAYVKERRPRVLRLSAQSYLAGSVMMSSSWVKTAVLLVILKVFFGGMSLRHARYDCGHL